MRIPYRLINRISQNHTYKMHPYMVFKTFKAHHSQIALSTIHSAGELRNEF